MTTITELRNEHDEVCHRLEALEEEMGKLLVGQVLEGSELITAFPNFISRAILPHFDIEERIVFPLLARGSSQERRLRDELMAEHSFLRNCFFSYALELQKQTVSEDLLVSVRNTCYHLAVHARKEDSLVLPLLRRWLGQGDDDPLPQHAPPVGFMENS